MGPNFAFEIQHAKSRQVCAHADNAIQRDMFMNGGLGGQAPRLSARGCSFNWHAFSDICGLCRILSFWNFRTAQILNLAYFEEVYRGLSCSFPLTHRKLPAFVRKKGVNKFLPESLCQKDRVSLRSDYWCEWWTLRDDNIIEVRTRLEFLSAPLGSFDPTPATVLVCMHTTWTLSVLLWTDQTAPTPARNYRDQSRAQGSSLTHSQNHSSWQGALRIGRGSHAFWSLELEFAAICKHSEIALQ